MPDEEKVRVKRRKLDSIITRLHQATPLESEDLEQAEQPNEAVKENAGVGERSESPPRSSRRKLNKVVKPKQTSKLSDEEALPQEEVQGATSVNGEEGKKEQVTCNGKGNTDDKIQPDRVLRMKLEPLESYENSLDGLQKMLGYSISEEVEKQKDGSKKKGRLLSESSDADAGVSELPRRVECTACGRKVNPAHGTICRHPLMNVLVCKRCSQYYNSGPFTRDEFGIDEQCRWCGDGGSLLCCDKCDKAFCKPCIKRSLGKSTLKEIVNAPEGEEWLCFCCNTKPLSKLVKACNRIMNILQTRKAQKTIFKTKKGSSLTDTPNQKERKSRLNSLGISSDGALSPSESPTKKKLDNDSEDDSDEDDSVTKRGSKKGHGNKHGKQNGSSENVVVIGDDSDSENALKTAKNSRGKRNKAQEDGRVKKKLVIKLDDENRGTRCKKRKAKQDRTSTDSSNNSDSNAGKQKSKSKTKKGQTKKTKTVEMQSSEEEEDGDSAAEKQASKTNSKAKYGGRRKGAVSNERLKEDDGSESDSDLSDFISMVKGNRKQAKKGGRKQNRGKTKKRVISDSEEEEEDEEEDGKRDRNIKRSRKSSVSQKQTRKRPRKAPSSEDASESSDDQSESDVPLMRYRRKQQQKKNKKKRVASESDGDDVSDVEEDSDEDAGRKKKGRSKRSKKSSSESEEDEKKGKRKGKWKSRGKGKKKGQKKHYMRNDSDESDEGEEEEEVSPSKRKGRKKIRKLIADEKLAEETQRARKLEEERRKRLLERTRNNEDDLPGESAKVSKLVLESDSDTKEAIVEVTEDLLQHLKPHQCKGIQFMYDCVIESVKSWKKDEPGGGCILAHCMGLGKTLQVVALIHTLMTHKDINMQRVLVVAPLNTVLNWKDEFDKWLSVDDRLEVLILQDIIGDNWRRADMLDHWFKYGGVLIMGYAMYRNLSQCFRVRSKNQKKIFKESLVDPGPDLVICDEGHILRNDGSAISKALNGIKTRRRIVLTGTPLQNNLIEYHCMVSFVKPNLLGTRKEFTNTFVNPIQNGQCADSTSMDVQIMKQRCHVLHKMLEGCVQRRDYSVLIPFLPRKHEYVIKVRLSALQRKLYQHFLSTFIAPDGDLGKKGVSLFSDYQALMRIWTHPWCLKLDALRRPETFVDSDSLDDFVVHTDEEGEEEEAQWESDQSSTSEEEEEEEEKQSSSDSEEERRKQRGRRRKKDSSSDEEGSDNEDEVLPQSSRRKQSSSKASSSTVNIDGEDITVVDIKDGAGPSRGKSSKNESLEDTKDREKKPGTTGNEKRSRNNSNNDTDSGNGSNSAFGSTRSGTAFKDVEGMEMEIEAEKEWYDEFLTEEDEFNVQLSGKLVLLMEILADAEAVGDKVLVFSQSLVTLDLIEKVLGGGDIGGDRENWCLGCDYFRMDGSTSVARRQRWTDIFNDEDNRNARLFLISTKAGGLGINLVAANRVIVFDVSWNPSHDVQSIFRVYRFGQSKAVYVYRFIAQGTMEEKIYDRQVTKLAISGRVVDEQQIERHYTSADLTELYTFNPDVLQDDEETEAEKQPEGEKEMETGNGDEGGGDTQVEKEKEGVTETSNREESGATKEAGVANSTGASKTAPERPTLPLPKDAVLADLINRLHPKWIVNYHEHDSLLQNIESEKLTEEEMKAAWEAYEAEKSGRLAYPRVPDTLQPNHAQTHQQVAERIRLNSEMLQQIQQITQLQEMQQRQEIEERMRRVRQQREQMYQQQREALLQQHQRRQEEMRRQNQLRFIQHMTQPAAASQLQLGQNTINVQTQLPGTASTHHPRPPSFQPLTLSYQLPSTIQLRLPAPPAGTTTSAGTPPTISLNAGPRAVGNNPQLLRPPQNPAPK